ncbi:MAG: sigma factor-like helix-turn-helix DNA-binding protein, partial [Bacteroides fragilis]
SVAGFQLRIARLKKVTQTLDKQLCFHLSREEHLSYKEIAIRLSISEKTVERHINEALKFLRKNIYLFFIFLSL